jgi:hypothetical protein
MLALSFQSLRSVLDVLGGGRGRIGVGLDAADIVRDVLGTLGGKLRAARDLLGRGALLLHRGGDGGRDFIDLADDAADALDRVDRIASDLLNVGDLLGNLLGRLGGLACQRLDSEATTAKPRPASPARAASMVAFSASRLVCAAMLLISPTTSPILPADVARPCTVPSVCRA